MANLPCCCCGRLDWIGQMQGVDFAAMMAMRSQAEVCWEFWIGWIQLACVSASWGGMGLGWRAVARRVPAAVAAFLFTSKAGLGGKGVIGRGGDEKRKAESGNEDGEKSRMPGELVRAWKNRAQFTWISLATPECGERLRPLEFAGGFAD